MASRTIKQILVDLKSQGYNVLPGFKGKQLKFEYATKEQVEQNKVDDLYQRMISVTKINSYAECNLSLLIAALISRRPEEFGDLAGDFIIDGQNKEIIYVNSGHEGDGNTSGCPQLVMEQEYNSSQSFEENYKRILKEEADLFYHVNTWRKKLSRIDELRAEVVIGDPLAIEIESIMKQLGLVSDRFGCKAKTAKEVKSFTQFYYTLTSDYNDDAKGALQPIIRSTKIQEGYILWKKIYADVPNGSKVHGTAFRAICFLSRYIDEGLTNGIQESFETWCIDNLARCFNQEKLVKGLGSFDSPRWTLYRIIDKYNDEITNQLGKGAPTIKEKRMVQAVEITGEERFKHPDDEEWKRILVKAKS
tara:strand:+ start:44 stop:1129 length:1086 start_codon:yes stop_codon:yes gene_type:complete